MSDEIKKAKEWFTYDLEQSEVGSITDHKRTDAYGRVLLAALTDCERELDEALYLLESASREGVLGQAIKERDEMQKALFDCDQERVSLFRECKRLKKDREGWAVRSKEDFDRLGKALDSVRRKRSTGEPACSDGEAVEELVAKCDRLEQDRKELAEALQDLLRTGEIATKSYFEDDPDDYTYQRMDEHVISLEYVKKVLAAIKSREVG